MSDFSGSQAPLVSVVMPAYKPDYLEEALASIARQTYRPLELIVCDDSRSESVETLVRAFHDSVDFPVTYSRNESRLYETRSSARAVALARGKYIKFLHDDDVFHPDCIGALVNVMENESDISLVSSRRRRIDEQGDPLPDTFATAFPFPHDMIFDGDDLVSFLGKNTINFIGEPSAVMCRRDDLLPFGDGLSVLNGVRITWVADLALYVKLLKIGNLAMLARPLTDFRVSTAQFSQLGRDKPGIGDEGHRNFKQALAVLGWCQDSQKGDVAVAPITRLSTRIFKPVNLLLRIREATASAGISAGQWLAARKPSDVQEKLINARLGALDGGPLFSLIVLDEQKDSAAIVRTLNSISAINRYQNFDVSVISLGEVLLESQSAQIHMCDSDGLVNSINEVVAEALGQWVLLLQAGDELTQSGLLVAALELAQASDCTAIYADEMMRDEEGALGVVLRPGLNLDLLLSFPRSMAEHWFFNREELLKRGGFLPNCGKAYELAYLLDHIAKNGLVGLGHISEPIVISPAQGLNSLPSEMQVVEAHLHARGYTEAKVSETLPARYSLDYGHQQQPLVSMIILASDGLASLQRCVESVLEQTSYPFYEVLLVAHPSTGAPAREWLISLQALGEARIRVLSLDNDSTADLYNHAAVQAKGEVLLVFSSSAAVVEPAWLRNMLNHVLRPEVGCVGGKSLAPDGRVRQAGIILGLQGVAGNAFEGLAPDDSGYMQRMQVAQNYSAVSADCLMVRKDVFEQIGGFDATPYIARWMDVDLCLRLGQQGYMHVWTPEAPLLVDARSSHPVLPVEEDAVYERWLPVIGRDPAYNPGFSLHAASGFKLADPQISWRPLDSWRPVPVILAHPADAFGCGHYRVIQPFRALRESGLIDGALSAGLMHPADFERYAPDSVILQRQIGVPRLEAMRRMKALSSAFKVYELDDYLPNLPLKNVHRAHMPKDVVRSLKQGLGYVDRFVVSTEPLADALSDYHQDIRVVENSLDPLWWSNIKVAPRREGSKPRVGWAGGASHTGDLELIRDVIKEFAGEVEWVFLGMCPDSLRPYVDEFHPGVAIEQYPAKLASLALDIALAPVEDNLFNECKSNLRLLEYGACGYPVICSDVRCYAGTLPVTRVKNRFRDWVDAIRMHLSDTQASGAQGLALQRAVEQDWMLKGERLDSWLQVWTP